jgi:hypothetical protein
MNLLWLWMRNIFSIDFPWPEVSWVLFRKKSRQTWWKKFYFTCLLCSRVPPFVLEFWFQFLENLVILADADRRSSDGKPSTWTISWDLLIAHQRVGFLFLSWPCHIQVFEWFSGARLHTGKPYRAGVTRHTFRLLKIRYNSAAVWVSHMCRSGSRNVSCRKGAWFKKQVIIPSRGHHRSPVLGRQLVAEKRLLPMSTNFWINPCSTNFLLRWIKTKLLLELLETEAKLWKQGKLIKERH